MLGGLGRSLASCGLALAATAASASEKLSDPVREAIKQHGSTDVLVVLKQAELMGIGKSLSGDAKLVATVHRLRTAAAADQRDLTRWLDQRGVGYRAFWVANFIAIENADAALVDELQSRPEVRSIEADGRLSKLPPAPVESLGPVKAVEPGVNRVSAPALWAMGFRGQGVLVAGQDTGYQWDHPAIRRQYAGWNGTSADHAYHWFDAIQSGGGSCGASSSQPCDDNGHGTHTMGTIVGDDGGTNQVGVAPDARWIACRNMDQGNGTPSTYAACFEFFLAPTDGAGMNPDPLRAPHIINNSWGCPPSEGCTAPNVLQTVVENVRSAGVLVVVSAGNDGSACNTINTPAAIYASAFTVGALGTSSSMAGYSSRGPVTVDGSNRMKPDVVAPGSSVRSSTRGNGYGSFSGTSMAGPHVAGVAALLMSIEPGLKRDPARIEGILRTTAINDVTNAQACGGIPSTAIPNNTIGYGRVDALNAARVGLGLIVVSGFE